MSTSLLWDFGQDSTAERSREPQAAVARVIETCCHAVHQGAFENFLRSTVALGVLLNAASEPAVVAVVVAVAHTINPSIKEAGGISVSFRPAQAL